MTRVWLELLPSAHGFLRIFFVSKKECCIHTLVKNWYNTTQRSTNTRDVYENNILPCLDMFYCNRQECVVHVKGLFKVHFFAVYTKQEVAVGSVNIIYFALMWVVLLNNVVTYRILLRTPKLIIYSRIFSMCSSFNKLLTSNKKWFYSRVTLLFFVRLQLTLYSSFFFLSFFYVFSLL